MRSKRYPYSGKRKEFTQLRVDSITLQKLESSSLVRKLQARQSLMQSEVNDLKRCLRSSDGNMSLDLSSGRIESEKRSETANLIKKINDVYLGIKHIGGRDSLNEYGRGQYDMLLRLKSKLETICDKEKASEDASADTES